MSVVTYRNNEERLKVLKALLKEDGNRECVDCGAKGPQWASWSLGVFICINCAGIHRSLGTHLSKVKSATLDNWTDEQLANMKNIGNIRARQYYEAHVPDSYPNPREGSSGQSLEHWIRAKYDRKQFVPRGQVSPQAYRDSPSDAQRRQPTSNGNAERDRQQREREQREREQREREQREREQREREQREREQREREQNQPKMSLLFQNQPAPNPTPANPSNPMLMNNLFSNNGPSSNGMNSNTSLFQQQPNPNTQQNMAFTNPNSSELLYTKNQMEFTPFTSASSSNPPSSLSSPAPTPLTATSSPSLLSPSTPQSSATNPATTLPSISSPTAHANNFWSQSSNLANLHNLGLGGNNMTPISTIYNGGATGMNPQMGGMGMNAVGVNGGMYGGYGMGGYMVNPMGQQQGMMAMNGMGGYGVPAGYVYMQNGMVGGYVPSAAVGGQANGAGQVGYGVQGQKFGY
eukprot:TRINITY_DN904_c0_g1_i1.p1 TRINITY_DN904_c0_g1~~TRINITY_DN904_c0_g1_i1.p1  ORF type:complete len:463 (-),score=170.36 TRINITY_DN904_c0_g1_i1:95-1483(-)